MWLCSGLLLHSLWVQGPSFDVEGVALGKARVIATRGLHHCDACSGSELQPGALGDSRPLGLTPIGEMTPVPTTVYMERVLRPGRIVPHT